MKKETIRIYLLAGKEESNEVLKQIRNLGIEMTSPEIKEPPGFLITMKMEDFIFLKMIMSDLIFTYSDTLDRYYAFFGPMEW